MADAVFTGEQIPGDGPWYRELTRYHWFVLMVAALGWMFDCLDQQLFNIARRPAMIELVGLEKGRPATNEEINQYGGLATSIFLIGWATGGLTFGVLGDRLGRARTMVYTILIYSLCTGLSATAHSFSMFAFYRFITGLGVGGEFAVGVALVAEVMPDRARPYALGLLQALSTVGNISAALISMVFGKVEEMGTVGGADGWSAWRWMFVVGAFPALLAILVRRRLKEPERWEAVKSTDPDKNKSLGSYSELFSRPDLRKNAIVGILLASSGVIGLWGIGFFSVDLVRAELKKEFEADGMLPAVVAGRLGIWAGVTSIMINVGAFFGMYGFGILSQRVGRRIAFAIAFVCAGLVTAFVFQYFRGRSDVFWMMPIMGFFQLSLFAGYAMYFPELFPTRLRSTGISLCYNVGRYIAAVGPYTIGQLSAVYARPDDPTFQPLRPAGVTMCAIFVLGLAVLPFAVETKGKPLPE